MFSESVFIANCMQFLCSNTYEDYEDVKVDIELFAENNLPSELKSLDLMCALCNKILAEYMKCDQEHSLLKAAPEDEDDDILYRSIEIWLAAGSVGCV